ncbi:MAG: site-specific DNA-methyltransferase [Acidobacteriales bacterium]|nr:site-specific DNA-methyltransferase [Terriglobales bacterium]
MTQQERHEQAELATLTDAQDVVECDVLVTDPPCGILDEPWEPPELEVFTREWAERWNECGAECALIFWSQRHLFAGRQWFDESLTNYCLQQILIWHYPNNKKPQSRNKRFKQTWEPVYFYRRRDSDLFLVSSYSGYEWGDGMNDCHVAAVPQSNYNGAERKVHPAQKPVSVFLWLINAISQPGQIVCDPFMGSGTSGIAAVQLGRRYHGIEIDEGFLAIARERISAYGFLAA